MSKKAYFQESVCVNELNNSVRTEKGFFSLAVSSKPNSPVVFFNKSFNISVIFAIFFFSAISNLTNTIQTDIRLERCIDRSTIGRLSTDISIDYLPTIDRVLTDNWALHRPSIWLWTECRPSTDTRWTVGKVSVKYRRSIGELKAISTDIRIDQYIDRYIVDASVESTYNRHDPKCQCK